MTSISDDVTPSGHARTATSSPAATISKPTSPVLFLYTPVIHNLREIEGVPAVVTDLLVSCRCFLICWRFQHLWGTSNIVPINTALLWSGSYICRKPLGNQRQTLLAVCIYSNSILTLGPGPFNLPSWPPWGVFQNQPPFTHSNPRPWNDQHSVVNIMADWRSFWSPLILC